VVRGYLYMAGFVPKLCKKRTILRTNLRTYLEPLYKKRTTFQAFETYFARYARTAWRLRDGWISVLAIQPHSDHRRALV